MGCTKLNDRGEVQVSIAADSSLPAMVEDLVARLEIQTAAGGWREVDMQRFDVNEQTQWPIRFLLSDNLDLLRGIYQLSATARNRQGAVVAQARAIREFSSGSKLEIELWFEESCVFRTCEAGLTCHGAECVDARRKFEPTPLAAAHSVPAQGTGDAGVAGAAADRPCMVASARSCAGVASRDPLECDGSVWRTQPACMENERCSNAPGDALGTCLPIVKDCAQREPDVAFCKDDTMLVCIDLVATEPRPCPLNEHCITTIAGARCDCNTGFRRDGSECHEATDCGSCDSLTRCTDLGGNRVCTACPDGFSGTGEQGCSPLLTGIAVPVSATLVPSFSPEQREYRLRVPVVTQNVTVDFKPPARSRVEVNGVASGEAMPWRSGLLALGDNAVQVAVIAESGATSTYRLIVERSATQEAVLKAQSPSSNDVFGLTIGLYADTLVVGAIYEDGSATLVNGEVDESTAESGAAYVYKRRDDGWQQQAYLKPNDTAREDYFGTSVAIWADTIAVGATHDDVINLGTAPTRSGVVYAYTRKQDTWVQQQRIAPASGEAGDLFGYHVMLEGDTMVVGAPGDGGGGSAYVFVRSGETWNEVQKLKPSQPMNDAMFGANVALFGDTIAVGAQADSSAARSAGAAYVFVKRGDTWQEQQQILPSPAQSSANFGYVLALHGNRLIVGAPRLTSILSLTSVPSGEAFVYERSAERWTQTALLKAAVPRSSDNFGVSVGINANTIVVGAGGDASDGHGFTADPASGDAPYSGAAYLFALEGNAWRQTTFFKVDGPRSNDMFGFAAFVTENAVVIGAPLESSGARGVNGSGSPGALSRSGAVYVFR